MAGYIISDLILDTPPPRTDRHYLAGTVVVNSLPVSKMVAVFDRITFALVAAKWSNPTTGNFEFEGLEEYPTNRLIVVVFDYAAEYNAAVFDMVSQVAVP